MPAVSVLTPVHNRPEDLRNLLRSLDAQTFSDFELVIVDDGSTPPVDAGVDPDDHPFPIRILRNPRNLGIGHARNRAVEAASGSLLVWLDSDSAARESGWLAGHVQYHREGLPTLGIAPGTPFVLHGRVRGLDTTLASVTFRYSNWFSSCQTRPYRAEGHHVPTNNTSLPRELMHRVGPFDPGFEVAEDIDWGLRALRLGVAMAYVPRLPVDHRDRETFAEVWRSYRKMGRFAARVRRKNPDSRRAWLYPASPPWAVTWALPLALLLSLYTVWAWFPREPKVLLYLPMLLFANLANSVGMVEQALWPVGNGLPRAG